MVFGGIDLVFWYNWNDKFSLKYTNTVHCANFEVNQPILRVTVLTYQYLYVLFTGLSNKHTLMSIEEHGQVL